MFFMGHFLRVLLYVWLSILSWIVVAQTPELPECAQICILEALGTTNTCSPTDTACICTNEVFKTNVTLCVTASCTIPEQLATVNGSSTTCGAPVRNRGPKYSLLSNVLFSIAAGFVITRFIFKLSFVQMELGNDDWAVLATAVVSVPSAIITVYGTVKYGLGQDIWALRPEDITTMLKYFYMMAILYFTQVALLKLCLLFFYIRVFPSQGVQRLLWGTVAFVVLWGFAFVVVAIFQCRPIRFFWEHWDGLHKGYCADINVVANTHAAISISLDFWILGIPLWQLRGLQMSWKKKLGVGLMFMVGTFVTVVSILRLKALVRFAQSTNASWEFYDVSVWSTIEICVGVMCACLPTIRQLLVRIFPIILDASTRSRNKYQDCEDSAQLSDINRNNNSNNAQAATLDSCLRTESHEVKEDEEAGILEEQSSTITRSNHETDEVSLVSHEVKMEAQ